MNFNELEEIKNSIYASLGSIPTYILENMLNTFAIDYTHNSTAIEGNTLTLIETKMILEDGISVGGKNMREIYEIVNHKKAFEFVKECVDKKEPLSESIIKDIHSITMENIIPGGIYRSCDVRISGAGHTPPNPNEMYNQIKWFYSMLDQKHNDNAIELAAYTHAEFVRIHPFTDGNGRTSRLLMNYQLMINNYLPISISKELRLKYYEALDYYATTSDIAPFSEMIYRLESEQLELYGTIIQQLEDDLNCEI